MHLYAANDKGMRWSPIFDRCFNWRYPTSRTWSSQQSYHNWNSPNFSFSELIRVGCNCFCLGWGLIFGKELIASLLLLYTYICTFTYLIFLVANFFAQRTLSGVNQSPIGIVLQCSFANLQHKLFTVLSYYENLLSYAPKSAFQSSFQSESFPSNRFRKKSTIF